MKRSYKIIYSADALDDLRDIYSYIAFNLTILIARVFYGGRDIENIIKEDQDY